MSSGWGWPGESNSDVIKSLIRERDAFAAQLAQAQNGYAVRNDEVTGLIAIEQELRARVKSLEAAMKIAHQALLEVAHAQDAGANWYTRGASGLYQQVAMWVRKGLEAIAAQHLSE